MCLGALVDAGVPLKEISKVLKKLPLKGYSLSERKVLRAGVSATKVDVLQSSGFAKKVQDAKRWEEIEKIVGASSLPDEIKRRGLGVFRLIYAAEAKVHGKAFRKVHLHELGAVDCLVDVFGTLAGLHLLGVRSVYSSAVNLGGGFVKTSHGTMPVPAPATAELLKDLPVYPSGVGFELTTPTGAALLKSLSNGFSEIPVFTPEKIGAGAGDRDLAQGPNILRIFIGNTLKESLEKAVTVIETNIDDMSPQAYQYVTERLFDGGALDVYLTPTVMKKMRPAVTLSVICDKTSRDNLIRILLRETTSIGLRYSEASRVTMERRSKGIRTKYGTVRVKFSSLGDIRKSSPEYEDCRRIAKKSGHSLLEVIEEAKKASAKGLGGNK